MKPSEVIIGSARRFVKGADTLYWQALDRCAKWVLAHPSRKVRAAQRRRGPVHTEAYRKATLQRYRAWISSADRN